MGYSHSRALQETRKRKIDQRNQTIKQSLATLQKIITQEKITKDTIDRVTRLPLQKVVDELNNLKITSKQLTAIYCWRTATIGLRLNLITEVNFEEAIKQAEKCDEIRRSSKKRNWTFQDSEEKIDNFLHPLFGVPISVKDTFDMKGLSSTIGITHRAFNLKEEDGVIVSAMKEGGLIPFTKSNVAQLAMTFQSNNYLWGRALNPWNQLRSPGGSSGGQGGLIAARCSALGIGSDVGGSIRIPSQFCGVYGFKPSDFRFSVNYQTQLTPALTGMDTIQFVMGPLSNSVEGLALWMKTVTNLSNFKGRNDPYNKNLPFDSKTYVEYQSKTKLRIGYFKQLDIIQCTKASQRAVDQTVKILTSLGHQVFQVQIPNQKQLVQALYIEICAEGGTQTFKKMLQGEDVIPQYKQLQEISQMSDLMFWLIKTLYKKTAPRLGFLINASGKKTVHEYLQHSGRVNELRQQFAKYWREKNLDFLIAPGFGYQSCTHGCSGSTLIAAAYTYIWNVLGTANGAMPITLSRLQEEVYETKHNDALKKVLKETTKGSQGLPVGIQVIGLPFEQQKVLGLMKCIQSQVKFYDNHPLPEIQQ